MRGNPAPAHVSGSDEIYASHADYGWDRVLAAVGRMRLALCVGTSFSVGVTDLVSSAARKAGVPLFAVDPNGSAGPVDPAVTWLPFKAEELLPQVCRELGVPDSQPS